ncbi:hypothetical protein D8S78_14845 [Natrialba swarupiae]|nr:hypothetical protein [Natrialba swarupiae]
MNLSIGGDGDDIPFVRKRNRNFSSGTQCVERVWIDNVMQRSQLLGSDLFALRRPSRPQGPLIRRTP